MTAPTEHKTLQACILKYAQGIGWKYVSRGGAELGRPMKELDDIPAQISLPPFAKGEVEGNASVGTCCRPGGRFQSLGQTGPTLKLPVVLPRSVDGSIR